MLRKVSDDVTPKITLLRLGLGLAMRGLLVGPTFRSAFFIGSVFLPLAFLLLHQKR